MLGANLRQHSVYDPLENEKGVAQSTVGQTLAEQLRITSTDIADRKRMLRLGENEIQALNTCCSHIIENIDRIVTEFYEVQVATPEIALVIGDIETLGRLKSAMRGYIIEMFSGLYDKEYVNKRLRVGKVHMRIGVSPKLYTTALSLLQTLLNKEVSTIREGDPERANQTKNALYKIFMFDIQLVFDTYIASMVAEVEANKFALESYTARLEEVVRERTRKIEELSRQDMLTELTNHRGFQEHLRRECASVERGNDPLTLAFIDLNAFKKVNDTFGHSRGDEIIAKAAEIIRASVRNTDIPCRYGGDEFVIIMPNTEIEDSKSLFSRLIDNLEVANADGLSFSIGVAESRKSAPRRPDELIKNADAAMYKAKLLFRKDQGNHAVYDMSTNGTHSENTVVFSRDQRIEAST